MKGKFEYIDEYGEKKIVFRSSDIPSDARDIYSFRVDPPDPPHSEEDHREIESIQEEYRIVHKRVYGFYPPKSA